MLAGRRRTGDPAADPSVIDTAGSGVTGNSSRSVGTGHISGLRGAYQQASDYGNINRGAVKVPARRDNKLIAMSLPTPHGTGTACQKYQLGFFYFWGGCVGMMVCN